MPQLGRNREGCYLHIREAFTATSPPCMAIVLSLTARPHLASIQEQAGSPVAHSGSFPLRPSAPLRFVAEGTFSEYLTVVRDTANGYRQVRRIRLAVSCTALTVLAIVDWKKLDDHLGG